jgi:hypothetical protein
MPGVFQDAIPHFPREVQCLGHPERLLVVPEADAEALAETLVERVLARVAEGRVPHVVSEPDRLRQVLVESQRSGNHTRDSSRLQRVRHPRSVMVTGRVDEHLRLAFEPSKRLRVQDPVAVALKRRPDEALVLVAKPTARPVRTNRERRQPCVFLRLDRLPKGIGNRSGELGHLRPRLVVGSAHERP